MDRGQTLKDLIIEHGLLKAEQIEEIQHRADKAGKKFEDIIREEKLIYPEPLAQLKATALGVPYIDLSAAKIDESAMEGISAKAADTYQFVAFGLSGGRLQVAMADPEDFQAQEAVRFIASQRGLKPDIYCAAPDAIKKAVTGDAGDARQALKDFGREFKRATNLPRESDKLRSALAKAPITKIVAVIIRHAIEGKATDIHIEPGAKQVRVRYRINGQLHTTLLLAADMLTTIVARVKILAGMPVEPAAVPQEGRFTFTGEEETYRVRVTTMPTLSGERITLQLIDATNPPPSFVDLGMSNEQQQLLSKYLHADGGLLVFTGPGQVGKSTTIIASLWEINSPDNAIATIEDTVEFEIPGVSQTQVRSRQGLTYAAALGSALRQDFDVIMIDQLADERTVDLAVQGAQAGRLILAATTAPAVVPAIEQLGASNINRYLLASALRLVVAQRLLPQLCPSCREAVPIPRDRRGEIAAELKSMPKTYLDAQTLPAKRSFFESAGCDDCQESKQQGQVALFEVVPIFAALRQAITNGTDSAAIEQLIRAKGYPSLRQDGLIKALQGRVRYVDVVHATA